MMNFTPEPQHLWLKKLLGEWTAETECLMGPDLPPVQMRGTESVAALGDAWIVGNWSTEQSEAGGCGLSIMTLGYDALKKKFIGTFVSSMMSHLWIYEGELDTAGNVLTLNATGPSFTGNGMAEYQDIIEIIDDDYRTLASQIKQADGSWVRFMTSHVRRKK